MTQHARNATHGGAHGVEMFAFAWQSTQVQHSSRGCHIPQCRDHVLQQEEVPAGRDLSLMGQIGLQRFTPAMLCAGNLNAEERCFGIRCPQAALQSQQVSASLTSHHKRMGSSHMLSPEPWSQVSPTARKGALGTFPDGWQGLHCGASNRHDGARH